MNPRSVLVVVLHAGSLLAPGGAASLDFDEASLVQKGPPRMRWRHRHRGGRGDASPQDECGEDAYVSPTAPGPQVREYMGRGAQTVQKGPMPRRVAIGFHGHYKRGGHGGQHVKCANFFQSEANIRQQIIQPLLDRGIEVAIYFNTVKGGNDTGLLDVLKPVKYEFDGGQQQVKDSYKKVLDLIARAEPPSGSTAVILLRFDVQYRVPLTDLDIKWDKVNFAFRDKPIQWQRCHKVSDLFHAFPLATAPNFTDALDYPSGCTDKMGSAHFIYDRLSSSLGQEKMNFINPVCLDSGVTWKWKEKSPMNTFLGINRPCPG